MKRGLRFWLVYAIAWLPYAASYVAVFVQQGSSVGSAVSDASSNVISAAVLGVGVLWLCRRLPWSLYRRPWFFVVHLGLAALYAVIWISTVRYPSLTLFRVRSVFMKTFACALCLCLVLLTAQLAQGDDVDRLLANSEAVTKSFRTLTAKIDLSWQTPGAPLKKNVGSVRLMKPNYALMVLTGDYPLITLASDGHFLYLLSDPTKYTIANAEPRGQNIDTPWWALPVRFFFTQSVKPFGPDSQDWTSSRYVGVATVEGESYSVVEIAGDKPTAYVARLYFDANKVLRRSVVTFGQGAGAAVFTAEIHGVRIGKRVRAAEFKFRPPRTARLDTGAESRMLAVGETGPDFALPTPEGNTLTLANIQRGQKATLINFWYIACIPCREEFRLFQKLYADWKEQGFAIVAINKIDDAAEIKAYVKNTGITFPIVMDERNVPGALGSYRIETYPSTYLLDSEGKIAYRFVGVNEAGLRGALQRLGLQN
ncbi:MAG: redoxin domain-containing protein [Pyrinomonadaceae bacterium]